MAMSDKIQTLLDKNINLPLEAVQPKEAARLDNCGITELYERLNRGEYESYTDGGKRLITLRSIRARQERLLAAASGTPREQASPRRGRPRKTATA